MNARYGGLFVCLAERIIGRGDSGPSPELPRPLRVRLAEARVKGNLRGFPDSVIIGPK